MTTLSKEKKLEISGLFLTALALFPVLWPAVQSILIIAFGIVSVFLYSNNFTTRIRDKRVIVTFFCLTAYYLWYFLTFLWSSDRLASLRDMQSNIILLIFPLIFVFFHPALNNAIRMRIQLVFVLAMVAYGCLWFQSYQAGVGHYQVLRLKEVPIGEGSLIDQVRFFFDKGYYWIAGTSLRGYRLAGEETKLFLHHTYVSTYFLLAFYCCLHLAGKIKNHLAKIVLYLVSVLFLLLVWYMPSAINKFATVITLPFFLYHFFSPRVALAGITLTVLILAGGIFKYQDQFSRIKFAEKDQLISTEPAIIDFYRYHVYRCTFEKVSESWLFGLGQGDIQPYLDSCLPHEEWPGLSDSKIFYNTHSQFIHYLFAGGLAGLLLYLLLWGRLFSFAITQKEKLLLIILMIVFANTIFENFISRIWGAFAFVFFTFVFLDLPLIKEPFPKADEAT